jgi:hypothetical protein
MLELLHDISHILNGGKVFYNTLATMDGKPIPLDITKIPEDAQIIVVSNQPQETIEAFKGLKGNVYNIKDKKEAETIRNLKNRHGI